MTNQSDMATGITSPQKPRRRVFANTLFSVLSKSQSALFSYISLRMLLSAMSIEEYGFYNLLFQAALQNVSLLFQLGFPTFIVRFIPEYYTQAKYKIIARIIRILTLTQLGLASVLVLIVFFFAEPLGNLLRFPGNAADLRIYSIGALAYLISENYRTILSSLFRLQAVFVVNLIYNSVRLLVIFLVTQYAFSLMGVVVAEVSLLTGGMILFMISYRRIMQPLTEQDRHEHEPIKWKRYLRYTGLCYLNEVGVLLVSGLDLFFVAGLLGTAAVGLYGLANRILILVNGVMPSMLLRSLIEPFFYSEFGSAEKKSLESGFSMLTKLISFVTFPTAIWLSLMSRPVIVHLFEAKYDDAAGILALFAFYLVLIDFRLPLGLVMLTAERIDLLIYTKVVGVFKILAALWLVPQGHILTMAWITLSSTLLEILLMYLFMYRSAGVRGDWIGFLRLALNGAASALIFLPMRGLFEGTIGVLLSIPVVGLIFLGTCHLNKAFSKRERDWLNAKLKYPVWVF
jgi:O-antigen/teichoic acid export membrane protein